MPMQIVTQEFITFRDTEWKKGTYNNQLGMDSLLLEWLLLRHEQIEAPTSWRNDGSLNGVKLDFKEIKTNFKTFGIPSIEKFKQLQESVDTNELEYFVFYNTKRNYNKDRSLRTGDKVKFIFKGIANVQEALDTAIESRYPSGYKFISLSSDIIHVL